MAGLGFLTIFTPYIRHRRLVAALAAKAAGSPSVPRQDSFLDMRSIAPTESSDKCFRIWRERERTKAPALLSIGSNESSRLSLSMVASLQSPLPFHLRSHCSSARPSVPTSG
jgi:hypothetical protein